MRRFANCGHPATPENMVKNGNGGVRCKQCREAWLVNTGRKKPVITVRERKPFPKCVACGAERPDRRKTATGLCRECFNKDPGDALRGDFQREGAAMRTAVATAARMLVNALWREHPAILKTLTDKNKVRMRDAA